MVRLSRFEERPRREVEGGSLRRVGVVLVEGEGVGVGRVDFGRRVRRRGVVGIVGACGWG